ncbi:hypothetical protein CTAYLR_007466 [Chrysophaeum taylorii]|uniref:ELMO domain-containing protein n=1 Tax=Chrysophaeum taylorii TaxID=2483200 RepID=A0AAD7UBR7_9STRA|nr:hypothetical protein CTAYLR_007466 [Chrysophaeum taylorii]
MPSSAEMRSSGEALLNATSSSANAAASYASISANAAASYAARGASYAGAAVDKAAKSIQAAVAEMEHDKQRAGAPEREASAPPSASALENLRTLHELATAGVAHPSYEPLLRELWGSMSSEPYERRGDGWRSLGFVTSDPDDDVRGGGLLALRSLVHFATRYGPKARGAAAKGAPLGAAGVAVSRELARLCDIGSPLGFFPRHRPFWGPLEADDGFYDLFSVGLSVALREWADASPQAAPRARALLAHATRAASQELQNLLAMGPRTLDDLYILARTVPGSPQHDQIAELARVADRTAHTDFYDDDDDDDDVATDDDDDAAAAAGTRRQNLPSSPLNKNQEEDAETDTTSPPRHDPLDDEDVVEDQPPARDHLFTKI